MSKQYAGLRRANCVFHFSSIWYKNYEDVPQVSYLNFVNIIKEFLKSRLSLMHMTRLLYKLYKLTINPASFTIRI